MNYDTGDRLDIDLSTRIIANQFYWHYVILQHKSNPQEAQLRGIANQNHSAESRSPILTHNTYALNLANIWARPIDPECYRCCGHCD